MFKSNKHRLALGSLLGCGIILLIFVSIARPDPKWANPGKRQFLSPTVSFGPLKQQNARPVGIEEIKKRFPKVDYDAPEPSDINERAKRRKKGKHYNNGYISKEPTRYSSGLVSEWDFSLPALPVTESGAVVVASTLKGGAFLSSDRTGVYTELSAQIEEVLKADNESVFGGKVIDISRMGGVVRYHTGEESLFLIVGQNMPGIGKRYLFFLKTIPESEDFEIITGYELTPSGVIALDTPAQFTHYNGWDNATFLQLARTDIANQKNKSKS